MPKKFFGEFLIDRGAITREMLLEAVKHEPNIGHPFCVMAIEKGFLIEPQLAALDEEAKAPSGAAVRVELENGKIAFRSTPKAHTDLSEKTRLLAEALIQKGYLKLTHAAKFLDAYKKQSLGEDKQFWTYQRIRESILKGTPQAEFISIVLQITIDTFTHYTKMPVNPDYVRSGSDARRDCEYVFTQRITGDRRCYYVLGFTAELVMAIGSRLLERNCHEVDAEALDAVTEFMNIVVGESCRKLSSKDCKVSAEPPKVTTKGMMHTFLSQSCITAKMDTDLGSFYLMFFFER